MNTLHKEIRYTESVPSEHIKSLGQYFTKYDVAEFMCAWACKDAKTMLDPAVGNSVFLSFAKKINPACSLTGYEIDERILQFFGNPSNANIRNEDYLRNGWQEKYDAIVCNPPYNRFQAVNHRNEILESIYQHTGVKYSGYTNLYILFLIKSIYQLSDHGKLAFIIPSEFLNSGYGTAVKQFMLDRKLLRAIIHFENDSEMFYNATTTCCILLLDHTPKTFVTFYHLSSVQELSMERLSGNAMDSIRIEYSKLKAEDKWRSYLKQEEKIEYLNLRPVSDFCSVSRGIATGANDFFCFSLEKAKRYGIPRHCLTECICRSADVRSPVFAIADFEKLSQADKTVYLLDVSENEYQEIAGYIAYGVENGINKKYLPSCRKPWYSMEQKQVAPIWVSSACRNGIKFVRNVAMVKSLTTFHSVYVRSTFIRETDLIFCYFLTPVAQSILRENRKELGNGLEKFQPNDLNTAKMLDITLISRQDCERIMDIYRRLKGGADKVLIEQLNGIFSSYLQEGSNCTFDHAPGLSRPGS